MGEEAGINDRKHFARPAHLIDLNRLTKLDAIDVTDDGLSLGAMVRQRTLERSPVIEKQCPLLTQALPYVGHAQIRNRRVGAGLSTQPKPCRGEGEHS